MKTLTQISQQDNFNDDYKTQLCNRLQNAFAEEINAWYGYIIISKSLLGTNRKDLENFFIETAKDEYEDHAMWILERLSQLKQAPTLVLSPDMLNIAKHKYIVPDQISQHGYISTLRAIEINIENEKGAIETYKELEQFTRNIDVVTNDKIKHILADEEEHLSELQDFYDDLSKIPDNSRDEYSDFKTTINISDILTEL